ncbi:MAG TPA: hypothetical protein VLR50_05630 [Desulfobacterales bacterium]|nr:hypothetical protein [Desulfobacterales bacterium]
MSQAVNGMADKEGKYLTFSLANEEYGHSILKIREIIKILLGITRVLSSEEPMLLVEAA